MGLDSFGGSSNEEDASSNNRGGSGKEYYRFSRSEFEDFLDNSGYSWFVLSAEDDQNMTFSKEVVYYIPIWDHDELGIRIYSTIDKRSQMARDKGNDAIRCVIWSDEAERPIGGRKKTLRIQTWEKNLKKKIDSLKKEWKSYVTDCDECGSWMVEREGEYGAFLGCIEYPDCENTKQIDD